MRLERLTTIVVAMIALCDCAVRADDRPVDRPVIDFPANGQHIGEPKDPLCPPENQPCFRIEAEGRAPKGTFPFFAVEPMEVAPKMFIQPRIHAAGPNGAVAGTVYLGEEDNGAKQYFKIYLLACDDESLLDKRRTILRVPKGCAVSEVVRVYRVR